MLLLSIFIVIFGLIGFIIWQIKRLIKMKRTGNWPPRGIEQKTHAIPMIDGRIFQLIETVGIISTSKNIDTITGRYSFAVQLTSELKEFTNSPKYRPSFLRAMDEYKQMYFDVTVIPEQIHIATKPEDTTLLLNYYCSNYMRAFYMSAKKHVDDISGLKQRKAINNRYDKIIELCKLAHDEIYLRKPPQYHDYLNEIFKIKREAEIQKEL